MVAIDCDGTLLTKKKEITQRSLDALERLRSSGIALVIATARPYYRIKKYLNMIDLFSDNDYSVTFNGGMVINNKTEKVIYSCSLSSKEIRRLLDIAEKYNKNVFLYTSDGIYASYYDEEYVKRNKDASYKVVDVNETNWDEEKIYKFVYVNQPEEIIKLRNSLPKELFDEFELTSSVPQFIEVVKKDVSKAEALSLLAEMNNISLKEIMVFGDEDNDLSMMKAAGYSVAMENGSDIVKEAASFITKTNDEEGFAFAIDYIYNTTDLFSN